jgi:hypothetical protein
VNRLTVALLCLTLFVGPRTSTASATSRPVASIKTSLVSCLQQEYLMRDVYQGIFAKYPALTAFGTVAADEVAMIATLKKVFAKYKLAVPTSSRVSAARTVASTATSASTAYAVAIALEQSTVRLMTQLRQRTDSQDALGVAALIRSASLGSHTRAFATERARLAVPTPPAPTQRVVSFTPSQASSDFLTLLKDESIDVIELEGTYRLPYMIINIDRTRPVVVRPVAGATVVMSGANYGGEPQFYFGRGGKAGNITMQGFIFDGFVLSQTGIIHVFNAHDVTLNDMVVRNSRANGTTALPRHAWALYLSSNATVRPVNITANRWIIDGSARQMSALQVYGGSNVTATDWSVEHAYYAIYASNEQGPVDNLVLDAWTIDDTCPMRSGTDSQAVSFRNASGRFSNMRARASGGLLNVGTPRMTDGGGNSL